MNIGELKELSHKEKLKSKKKDDRHIIQSWGVDFFHGCCFLSFWLVIGGGILAGFFSLGLR
jgi:hypothetical protein